MRRLAPAILSVVLALGLQALAQTAPPAEHGVQTTTIDPSVKPCDDFFQYANGLWLKTTKIPAEYSSWDTSTEIYERNMALLKSILDDAAKDMSAAKGSVRSSRAISIPAAWKKHPSKRRASRPWPPVSPTLDP